jgi:hypothetical protein
MVDMGQADRTLYRKPASMQHRMAWTIALSRAAEKMGFAHYMDVPDELIEELKTLARLIQSGEKS